MGCSVLFNSAKCLVRLRCETIGQCLSAFMTDVNKASLRIETYKEPQKNFAYIGMESVEKYRRIIGFTNS